MENLVLETGAKNKSELLELKNLHENIKNLIEKDFISVSDLYCSDLFKAIKAMDNLIESDLIELENNGY